MFKKLVSLMLCATVVASLCGCSETNEVKKDELNQEYVSTIRDAAKKLNTTYTDYIISNTLNAPDGDTEYIEVVHDKVSYTEYSVDADDNLGTLEYGSDDSMSYALTDWLTEDGKYYVFAADNEGKTVIYSANDKYKYYVEDRPYLYVNMLLDNAISVSKYDDLELDLGEGAETFTSYKVKVKGESLKEILGASSYGVYKSLVDDENTDKNISKLCGYYLEDLDMNLTFSDANVIVGIDSNGILKYICLETGGLGTRLYLTKAVVSTRNPNLRDTPDFTGAVDFASTLKELADYVSSYDSYDDALRALDSFQPSEDSVLTDHSDEYLSEETEDIQETETEEIQETETIVETEEIEEE